MVGFLDLRKLSMDRHLDAKLLQGLEEFLPLPMAPDMEALGRCLVMALARSAAMSFAEGLPSTFDSARMAFFAMTRPR